MQFNSISYLVFLLLFTVIYFQLKGKWRVYFCLLSSYFFYAWWDWRFLSLILASTLIDYGVGRKLQNEENLKRRRQYLYISLVSNLSILGFFKYFNFFVDSLQSSFAIVGVYLSQPTLSIVLPIGISFYTFQSLSYTIDVYRRRIQPEREFVYFATYIAFFPQLVAGPILRTKEFLPQLKINHLFNEKLMISGLTLILWGYFQKVVVADSLAPFIDQCFQNPTYFSGLHLSVGVFFYAFQIYGDFAGYSNIAIGSALILGFHYPKNFNTPYFAESFQQFWRKWHITLSNWLRDYLYIPLGGSKKNRIYTFRNLMITMFLGGLWHGAAWTFVIWGLLHGLYLVGERLILDFGKSMNFIYRSGLMVRLARTFIVFVFVGFAWIFFRSPDFDTAFIFMRKIGSELWTGPHVIVQKLVITKGLFLIVILVMVEIAQKLLRIDQKVLENTQWRIIAYTALLILILLFGTFNHESFIYFQF